MGRPGPAPHSARIGQGLAAGGEGLVRRRPGYRHPPGRTRPPAELSTPRWDSAVGSLLCAAWAEPTASRSHSSTSSASSRPEPSWRPSTCRWRGPATVCSCLRAQAINATPPQPVHRISRAAGATRAGAGAQCMTAMHRVIHGLAPERRRTALRAVETGRPVVHATLTGSSAAYDWQRRRLAWFDTRHRGAVVVCPCRGPSGRPRTCGTGTGCSSGRSRSWPPAPPPPRRPSARRAGPARATG